MAGKFLGAGLATVLALCGCARSCPPGLARMQGVRLFFGGSLTDDAWAGFAATTLTPAYPDGFTTYDAAGQWRDPATGHLVRERTRVVEVLGTRALSGVDYVTAVYKQRFSQQSVGVALEDVCAGF